MDIQTLDTEALALQKAQEKLASVFIQYKDVPTLFMSSGGSALKMLPQSLEVELGKNLTLTVLDERYSSDPNENNFLQFSKTLFFKQAVNRGSHVIRTVPENTESLTDFAVRFEQELIAWTTVNPTGKIIATLGMGEDGHTAGIMPYPEDPNMFSVLFEDEAVWVKGVNVGEKSQYPERVTVTNTFLRSKVDTAIAFVSGEGKPAALRKVLDSKESIADVPARVWHFMKDVTIFTDIKH